MLQRPTTPGRALPSLTRGAKTHPGLWGSEPQSVPLCRSTRPPPQNPLQERHVRTPPPIPAALDELRRRVQTLPRAGVLAERQVQKRPFEVDIGEEEQHVPAFGDLLGLVEVGFRGRPFAVDAAERRAGQETADDELLLPCLAQPLNGSVQVHFRKFVSALPSCRVTSFERLPVSLSSPQSHAESRPMTWTSNGRFGIRRVSR